MSRIDRYINDIMRKIYASREKKEQFANDLRSHIEEGISSGDDENTVLRRLGDPEDIAREFMSEVKLNYATIFQRFIAFFLDMSICYSFTVPLFFLVLGFPLFSNSFSFSQDVFNISALFSILDEEFFSDPVRIKMGILNFLLLVSLFFSMLGLFIVYFPFFEYRYGKTPGKHLMGIRVINENGGEASLGSVFLRRLSYYLDILALDSFFILFSQKRQRAFDMIAKTVVVKESHIHMTALRIILIIVLLILPIFTVFFFIPKPVIGVIL